MRKSEIQERIDSLRKQIDELEKIVSIHFETSVKDHMTRSSVLDKAQMEHLIRGLSVLREEDKAEFLKGLIEVHGDSDRTRDLMLDWLATVEALEEDAKLGNDDSELKEYRLS